MSDNCTLGNTPAPPSPPPGWCWLRVFPYSGNPIQHSELCTIHYATCHMHYALDVTHLLLVIQFLSATLVFSTTLAMRCPNTNTNRDVLPTLVKWWMEYQPLIIDNEYKKKKTFPFSSSGGFWWTSWPGQEGREWLETSRGTLPTFTLINTCRFFHLKFWLIHLAFSFSNLN